jgi:hypothetical protein
MPPQIKMQPDDSKAKLRFAEDILAPRRVKETAKPSKSKKKKKGAYTKDAGEDTGKAKKGRRDYTVEEDEEYF